jgi:MHS family proline/betaine transporter-like MFS transporter
VLGLTEGHALIANSAAMAAMLLLIYPAARMADRVGRKPVLIAAIVAMMLVLYPAFHMMHSGVFGQIIAGQVILALIVGWYLAPMPAFLVEVFPTSVRYTGMSLSYNFCAILGGFTPAIADRLIKFSGDPMSVLWIIVAAGVLSFIALFFYKDNWRDPLPV